MINEPLSKNEADILKQQFVSPLELTISRRPDGTPKSQSEDFQSNMSEQGKKR
jgi:hypothetical protein